MAMAHASSAAKLDVIRLSIDNAPRSFFFRQASKSDAGVIQQVLVQRCYDLHAFRQAAPLGALYKKLVAGGAVPLIVDAGANIGASTVWFACNFPGSHVVAVEPAKDNCDLLRDNCRGLEHTLLEGAIGSHDGDAVLHDPGRGEWAYQVRTAGAGYRVPLFSASGIVARSKAAGMHPFACKIDIEGGEAELFSDNFAWLAEFAVIVIELHDWLFPGASISRNFRRAIDGLDVDVVTRGENVFVFNHGVYS